MPRRIVVEQQHLAADGDDDLALDAGIELLAQRLDRTLLAALPPLPAGDGAEERDQRRRWSSLMQGQVQHREQDAEDDSQPHVGSYLHVSWTPCGTISQANGVPWLPS
jgi:hypothetical protein